jgi:hypothetical protein
MFQNKIVKTYVRIGILEKRMDKAIKSYTMHLIHQVPIFIPIFPLMID